MKKYVIDDVDRKFIIKYKYFVAKNGYLVRNVKLSVNKWTQKYLHRDIGEKMNIIEKGKYIDHINRNKLDNRRSNLRCLSPQDSVINRDIVKKSMSGFTGVSWDKSRGKWVVRIGRNGTIFQKRYFELQEAISVRLKLEKQYFSGIKIC